MFKPLIAATFGLSAMATIASADMIIVQSGPNSPAPAIHAYDGPSFSRMVEMCARFGFACGVPGADHIAVDAPHPLFSPEAQADADKRLAVLAQDWEEYAAQIQPARIQPFTSLDDLFGPSDLFGWDHAPDAHDILSWMAPRTQPFRGLNVNPFGYRAPPLTRPNTFGATGFWGPVTIPQVTAPHILRPSYSFPRTLPHGGLIPWPTL